MASVRLLMSTGNLQADAELARIVGEFEAHFPGRIIGYYLHGSRADGTAIAASDLDVDVVVQGGIHDADEHDAFQELARTVVESSTQDLDIGMNDERSLARGADPQSKLGAQILFGTDIRPTVPLITVEEWGRERMHLGYFLLMTVFDRQSPARYPLQYPNPEGDFFGYTNRYVRGSDGVRVPSTRNLTRVTGWLATALLAHEAGRYVVHKRECHHLYRELFNDEWAPLLDEIYEVCRGAWAYQIPRSAADRARLCSICRRVLAFENHFLTRYKPFLLGELRGAKEGRESRAPWLMRHIPFDDPEVSAALEEASGTL